MSIYCDISPYDELMRMGPIPAVSFSHCNLNLIYPFNFSFPTTLLFPSSFSSNNSVKIIYFSPFSTSHPDEMHNLALTPSFMINLPWRRCQDAGMFFL